LEKFVHQTAEIMWSIFTHCLGHFRRIYTENTKRESTKLFHMFGSGQDLNIHA